MRRVSEEANDEMAGAHFIDVEEIIDVDEKLQGSEHRNREKLRTRLCRARSRYRQKRELHDCMFEDGLALEKLINETKAENKYLTSKMKELQQHVDYIKRTREEQDEEALRHQLLSTEESFVKSKLIYIRRMEKENQRLREKNEDLTAELEKLSLGNKYREEIHNLRTAEQDYKKLSEVQGVLSRKGDVIEKKSVSLIEKKREIEEHFNTIEDLRQEQRELQKELCSRQEKQILAALNFQTESKTLSEQRQPRGSSAADKDGERHKVESLPKTESCWRCGARALWKGVKVAGTITLCAILSVGIMASVVPDYNLWNVAFDLLEHYSEFHHPHPPIY